MTEEEVVKIIGDHIAEQFPKDCPCCGRCFVSLADYLQNTTHAGDPVSYDAEKNDWEPSNPLGTISLSNCSCGSTLSIDSEGMGLWTMWTLLLWAKLETRRRGITVGELLAHLRKEIDRRELEESSG